MDPRVQNAKLADLIQSRGVAPRPAPALTTPQGSEFANVLGDKLKVSGHAQTRLASRNIELGSAEWDRISQGVDRAAAKGARESLVMMDDVALVVSVKNRTVITAVDRAHLKDNVFTNIDSAVIV
ncbi:MAG: TIGR02530 family flagellar biosynthesis protein [Fimbriimonadales bacterium]